MNDKFASGFAQDLESMIALKCALGYSENTYLEKAKSFDRRCFEVYPGQQELTHCAELAEARTGEITADHPREGSFCQGVGEISKIHRESGIYPPRPVYCRRHCIHSLSVWG